MHYLRNLFDRAQGWLERRFPDWAHRQHLQKWDRKWSNPGFNPFWKTEQPQKELISAVQSGWFSKGQKFLDIGCGNGEVSRWLANEGFSVTGVDYSAAAIENCRRVSEGQENAPEFRVADLCDPSLRLEPVANLIDRGCFHRIAEKSLPVFVQNLARATVKGGHFLLLAGTFQRSDFTHYRGARSEDQLEDHVERVFGEFFTVDRAEPTVINSANDEAAMPAVAFWMTRNGEGTSE